MKSHLTDDFAACFRKLPKRIQDLARKNYRLWKRDSSHPSLQFKRVAKKPAVYSIRVGIGWRALGVIGGEDIIWFWIGSHADYEKLINKI